MATNTGDHPRKLTIMQAFNTEYEMPMIAKGRNQNNREEGRIPRRESMLDEEPSMNIHKSVHMSYHNQIERPL